MTWTPETNRIPWGLLTEDEQAALQACEHGWVLYTKKGAWKACASPSHGSVVYRAKPAPKRMVIWLHWCEKEGFELTRSKEDAINWRKGIGGWIKRIEMDEDGSDPQIFVEDM